jgi:hypothetical protein
MPNYSTTSGNDIVATSPGDIFINFITNTGITEIIPLKTFGWTETNSVTSEYGIGNHEKYAQVQGKKEYKIDFTLGSWWVTNAENPVTWEHLLNDNLLFKNDQRLSREFDVTITGRAGTDYETSQFKGPVRGAGGIIDHFQRCIMTDSGGDVPEVGGTVSRKYSAVCFTILSDPGGAETTPVTNYTNNSGL